MEKILTSCASCGYPIAVSKNGESITCPMCLSRNIAALAESAASFLANPIGFALTVLASFSVGYALGRRK